MAIDKSNGPIQTNLIDKNVEIVTPEEMISDKYIPEKIFDRLYTK